MSLGQIAAISGIISAFAVFAIVLAWGDYQTRPASSRVRDDQRRENKAVAFDRSAQAPKQLKPELHDESDPVISGV